MRNVRKNIFVFAFAVIAAITVCIVCLFISLMLSENGDLALNEIKAYFRRTVYLDFHPNVDEIYEIQVGGTVSLQIYDSYERDCAIYNTTRHIEQITDYLTTLKLAEATEEELPNKSCDSFIQYYDKNGTLIRNFLIYGEIFIKDVNNKKIYRIKSTGSGIIDGLEELDFDKKT